MLDGYPSIAPSYLLEWRCQKYQKICPPGTTYFLPSLFFSPSVPTCYLRVRLMRWTQRNLRHKSLLSLRLSLSSLLLFIFVCTTFVNSRVRCPPETVCFILLRCAIVRFRSTSFTPSFKTISFRLLDSRPTKLIGGRLRLLRSNEIVTTRPEADNVKVSSLLFRWQMRVWQIEVNTRRFLFC